jgi:hypothetical protein
MVDTVNRVHNLEELAHRLHERRRQLNEWLRVEETSREGAHDWKAEVLRGRLQETDWALQLIEG